VVVDVADQVFAVLIYFIVIGIPAIITTEFFVDAAFDRFSAFQTVF
jgi:hypothetical protein